MAFIENILRQPRVTVRPDRLYSPDAVLDLFDLEPDQADLLAEWRTQGQGPRFTTLPDGQVRYLGQSLLDYLMPNGLEGGAQ